MTVIKTISQLIEIIIQYFSYAKFDPFLRPMDVGQIIVKENFETTVSQHQLSKYHAPVRSFHSFISRSPAST